MVLLLPLYFYLSYNFFNKNIDSEEIIINENYLKLSASIIVGFILLFIGSDFFISGLKDLALYYNIPEIILGLTLAAIGTSLPELAVTFSSVRNKAEKILLGNILGSNIINVLGALGISSLFGSMIVPDNFSLINYFYLIFSAIWLYLLTRIQLKQIYLGLFGLALYIIYIIFLN
tara:strand:- start:180 stop:704 length:525 start_codon:yes stop_codon:yes gene_type:complete